MARAKESLGSKAAKSRAKVAGSRASRVDGAAADNGGTAEPRAAALDTAPTLKDKPTLSPAAAVNAAFKEDEHVRAALARNIVPRAKEARRIADRATKAFANFLPSTFTEAEREARNYLAAGENLPQATNAIVKKGVAALKETSDKRTLRIHVDGALANLVTSAPGGGGRQIAREGLNKHLMRLLADAPTLTNDPTRAACDAKARAAKVLAEIDGTVVDDVPATPATTVVDDDDTDGTDNGSTSRVKQFVSKHVDGLLANVASPEKELQYIVNKRATLKDTETSRDSFQLRKGASDVTSYHDFRSLHIAFEHIWTEIFDGKLKSLGMELYHEAVKLEDFLLPNGQKLPPAVTSREDLVKLLGDIRELSDLAREAMPEVKNVSGPQDFNPFMWWMSRGTDKNPPVMIEASDTSTGTADDVKAPVAIIPGATRLSRLIEEVERMLNEGYAFHVFAGRSVNFGMMVTYRQTWRPEQYQVGDLVSTIPLAPREMRRYTTKRVVKKTRAVKEIEDSVRTTRSDTSGTSRVEREIVDKAQAKSSFDLTTHGSMGGEGYEADVTAKAGSEQATQSEKAKKHFHESVLKSARSTSSSTGWKSTRPRARRPRRPPFTRSRTRTTSWRSPTCSTSCSAPTGSARRFTS